MKNYFKILWIMLFGAFIAIGCSEEDQDQVSESQNQLIQTRTNDVWICHKPDGQNPHSIWVDASAVAAHLGHGDALLDADGDGYTAFNNCGEGSMDDCNDNDASINPGAEEVCGDDIDNNCDGQIDEDCGNYGNFDNYATGSQVVGQEGWTGWDNDPAFGAFTSDVHARSAPNSVDISGATDLVQEYSGYTSGQWVYTAYQYIPSTFSGTSFFIILNTYNAGGPYNWSTQVQFSSAGPGYVINTGVTGGILPLVTNQWVEIRVEIDLDVNTQDFYYNNQLLYSGTWTNEVGSPGILNIGALDLFAGGATSVYYDDISLD